MIGIVLRLLLVALIVAVLVRRARPAPRFTLELGPHGVRVRRGTVPPEFLEPCEDLLRRGLVEPGVVHGFGDDEDSELRFDADYPETSRQRLRNVWYASL